MTTGVYALVDEEMGWIVYVGSSRNLEGRWIIFQRELKRRDCPRKEVQEVYDRLGPKGISFEVLEETSLEERLEIEKRYIKLYEPQDNIWYTPRNEPLIQSRRDKLRGRKKSTEAIEATRSKNLGKKRSMEFRQRMTDTHKGVPWSERRREAWRKRYAT